MNPPVIVTIGKATQDVFLQSSQEFAHFEHKGVQYESLPVGQKLGLDSVTLSTGGNATNAAVTFARQGFVSRYIWCLGSDLASETILQALDSDGVDTTAVHQSVDYSASYSTILMLSGGERTIFNYKGKMPTGASHDFDFTGMHNADWLYISSLGDMELLERVISEARQYNVKITFNPAGSELEQSDQLMALLPEIEILTLNKEEAQMVVQGDTIEELATRLVHICPVVIVSDGPNGAVVCDGKQLIRAGMYEDVPVIDRTGGGDAFGSGFLSYYAQGKSIQESITFASANSTSVVQAVGAKEGIVFSNTVIHDMPLEVKDL